MFEFPQCLVFHKNSSNKGDFNDPPGVREIFRESDDVENQIRLPYSLSGITNASVVEPANAKREGHHRASLKRYLLFNIDTRWTDVILVLCGFVSGLVDGLSFAYWKSFSDMQTGMPLNKHYHGDQSTSNESFLIKQETSFGQPWAWPENLTNQTSYG